MRKEARKHHIAFEAETNGYFISRFLLPQAFRERLGLAEGLAENHGLNDRQNKAILYLKERKKITTKEYCQLTAVSLRTAKRDLLEMKRKSFIRFVGSPKTGFYALIEKKVHHHGTVNGTGNGTVPG